jgi:hypothetical protein
MKEFDPGALTTYRAFVAKLLRTKDPAEAMVVAVPVNKGIGIDEVKDSLKSIATANNFLFVGEAPFYKQVEAVTGRPFRHVSFMSFCDAKVGMQMADYNNAYTSLMPCRISVVEDSQGRLWLYTMDLQQTEKCPHRLGDGRAYGRAIRRAGRYSSLTSAAITPTAMASMPPTRMVSSDFSSLSR